MRDQAAATFRITPVSWSTYCFSVSMRSLRGFDFFALFSGFKGALGVTGVVGVKGAVRAGAGSNVDEEAMGDLGGGRGGEEEW